MIIKNKVIFFTIIFILYFMLSPGSIQAQEEGQIIKPPLLGIHWPEDFIPLVNLDAYGTYSNANSGSDVWGAIVAGSIAPVIKYDNSLYIIPLYDGSYKKQRFFAQTEEGGRTYNEVQHHDLSLTAKYLATEMLTLSPHIFGGWDLNVETNDEDWGDGLYDYNEFGSGFDLDYLIYDSKKDQVSFNGGAKWYLRHYPNFKALIALATVTPPEEDEKDYNAVEMSTGWQYTNRNNLSLNFRYYLLMKFFTDKKIIDADGILKNDKREEYRNTLRVEVSYSPTPESGFQYSCSSELIYNDSNQNFYDSRSTVVLTDDVFTPDYFDYLSLEVHPVVSYIIKSGDRTLAIIGGGYDFLIRGYLDRKAQLISGIYTSDEERDYMHIFEASLEIPLNENMSWITSYDYTVNKSNMDFEQFYEYNYRMHRILSGISFRY